MTSTLRFLPIFCVIFVCAFASCTISTEASKEVVDLQLTEVQQLFKAESVEAWTREETTSIGTGPHLTVEIVNSTASGTPGFDFERAKSGAALLSYAACNEAMRNDLIGIRIQPAKRPALAQVTKNSLFPTEKLAIQLRCKDVLDQLQEARQKGDRETLSRLTNSEIIPDSILFAAFASEEVKYGKFISARYQGAGEQRTQGNVHYKHFYYAETFENALVSVLYMVTIGPKYELVGIKAFEVE